MPAFANVVGIDYGNHGGTLVTHTFIPQQVVDGVATYVEAGATPLDDLKLTASRRITAENGRIKVTVKLSWPITATETINGVASPKLLRTAYGEMTVTADSSSTLQERENIITLLRDLTGVADQPCIVFTANQAVY